MTEILPSVTADSAEIRAMQERQWEMWQQSLDQQRADMVGNSWSQRALRKAGQDAENALGFLGEWQKTVNGNIEKTEMAQANGDFPGPQSGVDSGSLFDNTSNAEKKEDNMDAFGSILLGGSGG